MAIRTKGPAGSEVLELGDGASAAVSSGTTVIIRANSSTGAAEVSAFGGPYAALGGGGSVQLLPDETLYSFVNNLAGSGSPSMGSFASFTQGVSIMPVRERTVLGARFWCDLVAPTDFKASLWESGGGSRVADGTATIPIGVGVYDVLFSTPYVITASDVGTEFRLSLYHVSGTAYPRATTTGGFLPSIPFIAADIYIQSSFNLFASGDAYPSSVSGSEFYMIEPIFEKVTA